MNKPAAVIWVDEYEYYFDESDDDEDDNCVTPTGIEQCEKDGKE